MRAAEQCANVPICKCANWNAIMWLVMRECDNEVSDRNGKSDNDNGRSWREADSSSDVTVKA